MPPELVQAYNHYHVYSHSLVVLAAAAAILFALGARRSLWLCLPYALHIVMDIPTHERYLTKPFYPLSEWTFPGLSWGDARIFWPNLCALAAAFGFIGWRWWQKRRSKVGR